MLIFFFKSLLKNVDTRLIFHDGSDQCCVQKQNYLPAFTHYLVVSISCLGHIISLRAHVKLSVRYDSEPLRELLLLRIQSVTGFKSLFLLSDYFI